jgi:hypothetical protein
MPSDQTAIVRDALQDYADRGVFRGFREVAGRKNSIVFEILCFPFTQQPFQLVYTDKPACLVFKRLLQDMPAQSDMYRQFKSYMKERSSENLPAHRRIDPERVQLRCSNRLGDVNVTLGIQGQNHEYATRRAINLLTDLFLDLLTESPFYEFMEEHFDMPED